MKIFLIVQENQNDHGFVDTTMVDAFTDQRLAERAIETLASDAIDAGEYVAGKNAPADDWTVSYAVQEVTLYRAPRTSVESQVYIETGELPTLEDR